MKKYILIFLVLICQQSTGQKVQVKEISNIKAVKILTSVEFFTAIQGRKLMVKMFTVSNGSGSAHESGTDTITENLLFVVSEYDEEPEYKIYTAGPFYGLKILKKVESASGNTFTISLNHISGITGNRSKHQLQIDLRGIAYR
ncbi:MAG: hypothetical protein EOP45_12520 [Sphingobacteriaceae bacterium]|nr:MAG: hypothetical protein EOP45_12520 [Sphingobacteriaceae bacterium]